jgi:predicted glycoside hydrolase/deacetylase ChbG (UPF0249 family)
LTLDSPILPAEQVASLVQGDGRFHTLGTFITRLFTGRVSYHHLVAEFQAQLNRFREQVGQEPWVVNAHHHVQVFPQVGAALREVLSSCQPRPYLRRVRESFHTLRTIHGARCKRGFLSMLGGWQARRQASAGFIGADRLAGITNPPFVQDPEFFTRWLCNIAGDTVELTCHPGEHDPSLLGRDAEPGDGNLERRTQELHLLLQPEFSKRIVEQGFEVVRPSDLLSRTMKLRRAA